MQENTYDLNEFKNYVQTFTRALVPGDTAKVVALHGDLGAGKTTFAQILAKELGVVEHVISPTFVIQKTYELKDQAFTHLVHIDAYRLEKGEEISVLGWAELIADSKNLIVIEWPEHVAGLIPQHATHIQLAYVDDEHRSISLVGDDE